MACAQFPPFSTQASSMATVVDPSPLPLIPYFPDEISFQILARVPRFNYIFISLVSKSWHGAVKSDELLRIRSLLRISQSSLYLSLRIESSFRWYCQVRNPQTPMSAVIPLPSIPQHLSESLVVALGSKIYVIGGSVNDIPSNNVWIFDCRTNKWETGPRMRAARNCYAARVYGGRIFVMGERIKDDRTQSFNWAESFDPATGLWSTLFSSCRASGNWSGWKYYGLTDKEGVIHDVVTGDPGQVPNGVDLGWRGRPTEIDGVLYTFGDMGKIRGYDVGSNTSKELRGVENVLPEFLYRAAMVNLDGRLCVFWQVEGKGNKRIIDIMLAKIEAARSLDEDQMCVLWEGEGNEMTMDILCAEIEVATSVDGELMGTIVRVDDILTVPRGTTISHCLAVEV